MAIAESIQLSRYTRLFCCLGRWHRRIHYPTRLGFLKWPSWASLRPIMLFALA